MHQDLFGWFGAHRAQLRHSVRVTIAAAAAFALANGLKLPQGYWAVFTAIVVTQTSVGGSVKQGIDWFVGTMAGAALGIVVATFIPHGDLILRGCALVAVVAPLALLAAVRPSFRVAPLTAVIVVLGLNPAYTPLQSAFDRVLEVTIGSVIGVVVSLVVFPARAHAMVVQAAAEGLETCAALLAELMEALAAAKAPKPDALFTAFRKVIGRLESVADEAERERASRLTTEPTTAPIARTLRRLRSDLAMIARAADPPLPLEIASRLAPAMDAVKTAACGFMNDCAAALRTRQAAPDLAPLAVTLAAYANAFGQLRHEGATRPLNDEAAGRLFALGFALEQLHDNLKDMANRIVETAQDPGKRRGVV